MIQRPTKVDDFEIPAWWDCVWQRVPCEEDSCRFCGRINAQRRKHIARGEDPDTMEAAMEDVKENLAEVRLMIMRDAERLNIDLPQAPEHDNADDVDAMAHPRSRRSLAWRKRVYALADEEEGEGFWRATEEAADLFWYANTFVVKTARDIDNIHTLEQGDEMARVDFEYTRYVLASVGAILDNALAVLARSVEDHGAAFAALRIELAQIIQVEMRVA